MKIEVKNVKVHNDMSEETMCFSATVYVDGKKVGEASNRGNGGCNMYHWSNPVIEEQIEEYCASLPPLPLPENAEDWEKAVYPMKQTIDLVIGDLIAKADEHRNLKRLCRGKILFRKPDEKYAEGEYHSLKGQFCEKAKAFLIKKYGTSVVILNEQLA